MNWFKKHLNWTIFLFLVLSIIILVVVVLVTGYEEDNIAYLIVLLLLFVASFFVNGWILVQKNRNLWWLALNWLNFGWIIYMILENKTVKYTQAEQNNVLDLVGLWTRILKSLHQAMPQLLIQNINNSQNSSVSPDEFDMAISETLSKVEKVRINLIDKYQWPIFTNSETNDTIDKIKNKIGEFFDCELSGTRLLSTSIVSWGNSGPLINKRGANDLTNLTKKLNRCGESIWNLLAKLSKNYRISNEEFIQVVHNNWPDINSSQIKQPR